MVNKLATKKKLNVQRPFWMLRQLNSFKLIEVVGLMSATSFFILLIRYKLCYIMLIFTKLC